MKSGFKKNVDKNVINNIKSLGIDMINRAGSGHPGIVLGAAPIIYTLYSRHMNIAVSNPGWIGRDRFILSAGHGSALLYSTLFMMNYNILIDDLKNFRQLNSITPGHPEYKVTPGVDATTGPLGQGIAMAVGLAIGESYTKAALNCKLINNYTYALVSDGDLMEGISYEAASLAGTLNLNKLIVLYDSNNISLDGETSKSFTEDVLGRFKALGWNTIKVKQGNDIAKIDSAIKKAKSSKDKPTIIEIKTIIGQGSKYEGTNKVHGSPLSEEDIKKLKENLNINKEEFYYNEEYREYLRNNINERMANKITNWNEEYKKQENNEELKKYISNTPNINVAHLIDDNLLNSALSLREINGKIMNLISEHTKFLIGGSADLASSNKTYLNMSKRFKKEEENNKNIWYGVREHSMGAISNGIALYNLRPFASTFLAFSDYMKPAVRLSALMNLPVTYIYTHDSINIGQDGPTHQPIEQLAGLRSIPNINLFRPADIKETIGAWQYILDNQNTNILVLSRNKTDKLLNSKSELVIKGVYILEQETEPLHTIIIATGSEVSIAVKIKEDLQNGGIRVVSMPSMNLFNKMSEEYKSQILPKNIKTIVIEAGSSFGWGTFVTEEKHLITLNEFGKSGNSEELMKEYRFDYNSILERVKELLK